MRRRFDHWIKQRKRLEARLILFALITLLTVTTFGTIGLRKKRESYEKREQELQALIAGQEKRAEDIKELEKYMDTKKFVEEIAKERLGLVYEDEILFKAKE